MEHTLGQNLAYLIAEKTAREMALWSHLSPSEKKQLESLQNRLKEIKSDDDVANFFADIPEFECQAEKSYLMNNKDFFLALFLIGPQDNDFGKDCMRLSKHLNDCYKCFEIFCHVTRDFYHKFQELSKHSQ